MGQPGISDDLAGGNVGCAVCSVWIVAHGDTVSPRVTFSYLTVAEAKKNARPGYDKLRFRGHGANMPWICWFAVAFERR